MWTNPAHQTANINAADSSHLDPKLDRLMDD